MRDGVVPFWIKSLAPLSPFFLPTLPPLEKEGDRVISILWLNLPLWAGVSQPLTVKSPQCKEEKKGNAPPNVSLKKGERRHSSSALFGVSSRKSSISILWSTSFSQLTIDSLLGILKARKDCGQSTFFWWWSGDQYLRADIVWDKLMRKSVTLAEQNTVFSLRGWTKQ